LANWDGEHTTTKREKYFTIGGGGDPLDRVKQFSANPSEQNGVTGPHNKVAAAAAVRGNMSVSPQHALIHEQQEQ
jgi:hypothetical protein